MVAPAGRRQRQAEREGRDPAAGRRAAQPGTRPPLRRFHREELGLYAVAGDHRHQSRQGFRRRCIPSSCAASCSAPSIRPASPRTIRRWPRCCRRCASPENAWLLTWTIQEVFSKGEKPGRKGLWSSEQATRGILHQHRRPGSRAPGRIELREACAGAARGLPGALRGGRGAEDLRGLQGAHPVERPGDQRCLSTRRMSCRATEQSEETHMDTGLTTIAEADIEKHRATAQSMITRIRRAGGFCRTVGHRTRRHRPPLRLDGLDRLGAPDPRGRARQDGRRHPRPTTS